MRNSLSECVVGQTPARTVCPSSATCDCFSFKQLRVKLPLSRLNGGSSSRARPKIINQALNQVSLGHAKNNCRFGAPIESGALRAGGSARPVGLRAASHLWAPPLVNIIISNRGAPTTTTTTTQRRNDSLLGARPTTSCLSQSPTKSQASQVRPARVGSRASLMNEFDFAMSQQR